MNMKNKRKSKPTPTQQIVARTSEVRRLLSEFGVMLSGFNPGISGYFKDGRTRSYRGAGGEGYWGEPISINEATWGWLEPLLKELSERRKKEKVNAPVKT